MSRKRRNGSAVRSSGQKGVLLPVIWLILYLVAAKVWWTQTLYLQLLFFAGLIFYYRREFSLSRFAKCLTYGLRFWLPVAVTVLFVWLSYRCTDRFIAENYLGVPDGMIGIVTRGSAEIILFAFSTIFLMPVAEELFFRKACIRTEHGTFVLVLTFICGTVLYALSHALGWLGILEYLIIGVPLGLSYVLTRNIYVPIMAHMIVNIIENVPSIAYVFARMLLR